MRVECVCAVRDGVVQDCGTAQCAEDCHPEGGYCNVPGECLCNTHWNGTNCDQFLCHPNCSTVGGTCENAGGCDCLPEYTGGYCETGELQRFPLRFFHMLLLSSVDLNPCAHLSPCENEGMCSNEGPNQYSCACPSGYTGIDCEEDVDECKMSPCANQAICIVSDHATYAQKSLSGYKIGDPFFPKNHPGELPVFVCARLDRRAL